MKKPSVKKTAVDISQVSIYLRGVKRFGKTTLFRDVILEKFGDPSYGVLVGVGAEVGYKMISNINTIQLETWDDFIEFKEWLLSDDEDAKKIKMVAFDTVDEIVGIIEEEIIQRYRDETNEAIKSINQAYGGFHEGQKKACEELKRYMSELENAGIGVWRIGHTKYKKIPNKATIGDTEYKKLTSTLTSDYEGVFADISDLVLTGDIHREVEDCVVKSEERRLYFKDTEFVDAGTRGDNPNVFPDYILMDSENRAKLFIQIIEDGLEKSASGNLGSKSYQEYAKEAREEIDKELEENKKEKAKKEKLKKYQEYAKENGINLIKNNYQENKKFKDFVDNILKTNNVKKITDLPLTAITDIAMYAGEELKIINII